MRMVIWLNSLRWLCMTKVSPVKTVLFLSLHGYLLSVLVFLFREETVTVTQYPIDTAAHVWNVRQTAYTRVKLNLDFKCTYLFTLNLRLLSIIRLSMIGLSLFSIRLWWRKNYTWKRHGTVPSVTRRQNRTCKVWYGHGWWRMGGKLERGLFINNLLLN